MNSVGLCLDEESLSSIKGLKGLNVDIVICPYSLKKEAEKLSQKVVLLSGKPRKVYQDLMKDYALSLSKIGLDNTTNDSFKFLLNPTLEIFEILDKHETSSIYCFGGHDWSSLSIVSGDNVESSRAVLTSKKYFINLMVSQWCKNNNINLTWGKSSNYLLITRFVTRCLFLFISSFFLTLNGKSSSKFIYVTSSKKSAVYRKQTQKEILDDFLSKDDKNKLLKHEHFISSVVIQSTKRFFQLIYLSIVSITKNAKILTKKSTDIIVFNYEKHAYSFSATPTLLENNCLLDELFYSLSIKKFLKEHHVKELYSCEMVSRFAFIEREACRRFLIRSSGVQAGLVSSVVVPVFPIHDKFIAMSQSECNSLRRLYNSKDIYYCGPIRNFVQSTDVHVDILVVSQPYAQEIMQLVLDLIESSYPGLSCKFRKHPRDNYSYKLNSSNILLDDNSSCIDSIMESKVVVGMTTTVLEDAISANKDIIVVCMDEYTKNIVENDNNASKNVCTNLEQVKMMLEKLAVG